MIARRVGSGCAGFLNTTDTFSMQRTPVTGVATAIRFNHVDTNAVPPNTFDPQGTTNTHDSTRSRER